MVPANTARDESRRRSGGNDGSLKIVFLMVYSSTSDMRAGIHSVSGGGEGAATRRFPTRVEMTKRIEQGIAGWETWSQSSTSFDQVEERSR